MARSIGRDIAPIFAAVEHWKACCLLKDGSVFSEGRVWTINHLDELDTYFIQGFLTGEEHFLVKFQQQLEKATSGAKQLAAEMLWVLLLFPSNIGAVTKREQITKVWSWSGSNLDSTHQMLRLPLEKGVGSAGIAFNTQKYLEVAFFIRLMQAWKKLGTEHREHLLGDPWNFGNWVDSIDESEARQFRHMLLYLLFPDFYERVSSRKHKVALAEHFKAVTGVEQQLQSIPVRPEQDSKRVHLDKQLLAIRRSLEAGNPGQKIDFYQEPWDEWRNEDDDGAEARETREDKSSSHQFWIEKTIVAGRPDRETGESRLGIALWSPQKSQDGRDIYANMRNVRPGDVVLHLIDNSHFAGVSIVQSPCDDTFEGVEGTQWGTQPSYRISLSEYQPLTPPLSRKEFFERSEMAEELKRISKAQGGRGLFYTKDLDLNQGAYLTPAPPELIGTLNRLYRQLHNKSLPHMDQSNPQSKKSYWIFQGNPDYFDIRGMINKLREINWSVRQQASKIRAGDQVFIWQSGPEAGILGIGTVLSDPAMLPPLPEEQPFNRDLSKFTDTEMRVRLRVDRILPFPVTREEIKQRHDLVNLAILRAPQGTNFSLTEAEANVLLELTAATPPPPFSIYTVERFSAETGYSIDMIKQWRARLLRKKHIVLQGPPGTGKTFVAERLARLLMSETRGFWDLVQFHPSYAYEDFMQGIRPEVADGQLSFRLSPGRFLQFCQEASKRAASEPCILIVDEINRANLSRVFGELMYLLEYRHKAIPLSTSGEPFAVPENVYIIGTMNTADRSIALVDHALRRRFSFIFMGPEYDILQQHLEKSHLPTDSLIRALKSINSAINDRNYELGISFFLVDNENLKETLPIIWAGEIEPYLEEYFFDQPEKVDEFRWNKLSKGILSDWKS